MDEKFNYFGVPRRTGGGRSRKGEDPGDTQIFQHQSPSSIIVGTDTGEMRTPPPRPLVPPARSPSPTPKPTRKVPQSTHHDNRPPVEEEKQEVVGQTQGEDPPTSGSFPPSSRTDVGVAALSLPQEQRHQEPGAIRVGGDDVSTVTWEMVGSTGIPRDNDNRVETASHRPPVVQSRLVDENAERERIRQVAAEMVSGLHVATAVVIDRTVDGGDGGDETTTSSAMNNGDHSRRIQKLNKILLGSCALLIVVTVVAVVAVIQATTNNTSNPLADDLEPTTVDGGRVVPTSAPSSRPIYSPTSIPSPPTTPAVQLPLLVSETQRLEAFNDNPYIIDTESGEGFGYHCSIDGDYAAVGTVGGGAVYVFHRNADDGIWIQEAQLLSPSGRNDGFGEASVAVSGETILVGAHGGDNEVVGEGAGSAYIFIRNQTGMWELEQHLTADDASSESDEFGRSVALDGDRAIVGAPFSDDTGSAYMFSRSEHGTWQQDQKLLPPTNAISWLDERFGMSVALRNGIAAVGNYDRRVYVFRREPDTPTSWIGEESITISGATARFGRAVSLDSDTIVIGDWFFEVGQYGHAGSAFVFDWDGDSWEQQTRLEASNLDSATYMGRSVSICGDVAVVGADQAGPKDEGRVYVFRRRGDDWILELELFASDYLQEPVKKFFGLTAMSNDTILVGAWAAEAAYLYHLPTLAAC